MNFLSNIKQSNTELSYIGVQDLANSSNWESKSSLINKYNGLGDTYFEGLARENRK